MMENKKDIKKEASEDEIEISEELIPEDEVENPAKLLSKLREKLKKCETEKQDYLSGWQRAKADYVNARKEEEERRNEIVKFSEKKLVLELLNLADGFDMFSLNKDSWDKIDKNWRQGVENLHGQMMGILRSRGVEAIKSVGLVFNPKEHESIGETNIDKKEKDGIIVEELRKGYKMHGVVIKPSIVKIGKFKLDN